MAALGFHFQLSISLSVGGTWGRWSQRGVFGEGQLSRLGCSLATFPLCGGEVRLSILCGSEVRALRDFAPLRCVPMSMVSLLPLLLVLPGQPTGVTTRLNLCLGAMGHGHSCPLSWALDL